MYSSVSTKGSIFCIMELRDIRSLKGGAVKRKKKLQARYCWDTYCQALSTHKPSQYCNTTQYRGKSRETEEHAGTTEDREKKKHEKKKSMAKETMSERTLTEANLNATNSMSKKKKRAEKRRICKRTGNIWGEGWNLLVILLWRLYTNGKG